MSTQSPTLFERLGLKIAASEESLAQQKERQEREAREVNQLREQLKRRMDAVDNARARIEKAKRQFEEKKRHVEEFHQWILAYWGTDVECDTNYPSLLNLKAAIDDFPRVLTCLEGALKAAQKELSDFEKKHAI